MVFVPSKNISSVMLNKKFFFSRKKFNPFDNALGSLGKLDKGRESTSDVFKKMPIFSVLYGPT